MSITFNPTEGTIKIRCANKDCRAQSNLHAWHFSSRFACYTSPAKGTEHRIIEIICKNCGKIQLYAIDQATEENTRPPLLRDLPDAPKSKRPTEVSTTNANTQYIQDYVAYTAVDKANMEKNIEFVHKKDPLTKLSLRTILTEEDAKELFQQSTTQPQPAKQSRLPDDFGVPKGPPPPGTAAAAIRAAMSEFSHKPKPTEPTEPEEY